MSLTIESAPFIETVKRLIKQKGLTQAALAKKSGLSPSQLSRLLSGKNKRVQQATVDKIIAALGLTQKQFSALLDNKSVEENTSQLTSKTIYSDRLPTVSGTFIGRTAELEVLNDALANDDINILQFIAPGGTGKTKLLRHWLNAQSNSKQSIIAWSFYSQGATADKQISTSSFFDHALHVLNAEQTTFKSDEDKGDYLAALLRDQQCLLILDGVEPLQHADAANRGELKDRALARLLKNLAGQSGTFCVITTRIAVYELSDRASVISHNLQNLETTDGVALLESLGVTGKQENILKAVNNYAGHALALSLLGNLLRLRYRGDINKLDALPTLLQENADKTSRHAFKVMQAYQGWFAGTPELSLLYLLGLFDNPVELEAIETLWKAQIAGLTDGIRETEWLNAIDSLRHDHHILTEGEQTLDCHPLIREYFGGQLKQNKPETWQAAHECLYEYYKAVPEKDLPDTLEEMRPLFHAVRHGCGAGVYQQAFDEVYWSRISRKASYLASQLCAFGDELSVVLHFFTKPWDTFTENLKDDDKTRLIASVSLCLNALGRTVEATLASKKWLNALVEREKWALASTLSETISEEQLILGRISEAIETAHRGIKYSDKSDRPLKKVQSRAAYAKALHQAGDTKQALSHFEASGKIHTTENIDTPYLYSTWGYYDLMIELGQSNHVFEMIKKQQKLLTNFETELTPAYGLLDLAHVLFSVKAFSAAANSVEKAVSVFQKSGVKNLLPLALLTRASLSRQTNNFVKAHQDLQEVYDIAHPSGMRLYLTDYHLEMARLLLKQWQQQLLDDSAQADIQNHIASAVKLIDETGYHRRDKEVEALIGPSQITPDKQKEWSEEW